MALAGLFQACRQVDNLARLGSADSGDLETALYSLLQQNPPDTLAVYRDIGRLETGLETLRQVLEQPNEARNARVLRYALGALYLAGKVRRNRRLQKAVAEGIDRAARQAEHFSPTHPNVIANLADLYQNTLSTLNFRIQVRGTADMLGQESIASRIRCLLFSAVRSAVLWRQTGGKRGHLMLRRRQVLALCDELYREARRAAT